MLLRGSVLLEVVSLQLRLELELRAAAAAREGAAEVGVAQRSCCRQTRGRVPAEQPLRKAEKGSTEGRDKISQRRVGSAPLSPERNQQPPQSVRRDDACEGVGCGCGYGWLLPPSPSPSPLRPLARRSVS